MLIQNITLIVIMFISFCGILCLLINEQKTKNHELIFTLIAVIFLFLQLIFVVEPMSVQKEQSNLFLAIEYSFIIMSLISLLCIVALLSRFGELKENVQVSTVLLGGFQVAIFMVVSSFSSMSVHLKLLTNFYYLVIPSLFLYEINKNILLKEKSK